MNENNMCAKHAEQGGFIICLHQLCAARQENADPARLQKLQARAQKEKDRCGEPWATEARRLYATGRIISMRSGIELLECRTGELLILRQPTTKWAGPKTPLPDEQSIVHDINQAMTELACAHYVCNVDILHPDYQAGIEQALRACKPLILDPRVNPQDLVPLESFNGMLRTAQQVVKTKKNPCFCHPFVNAAVAFHQAWIAHKALNVTAVKPEEYSHGLALAIQTVAELHLA